MIVFPFAALVSLVSVLLMLGTSIHVGRARMQYQVKAPATTGHEMFERAYRIQVNTIESFLMMFPSLWIYAVFTDDLGAGVIGAIWLVGRVVYGLDYQKDPAKRGRGFMVGFFAIAALWLGGLYGVVDTLVN
jgi:glutathione S-transferase